MRCHLFFQHLLWTLAYSRYSTNVEGRERKKEENREKRKKRREVTGQEMSYLPIMQKD